MLGTHTQDSISDVLFIQKISDKICVIKYLYSVYNFMKFKAKNFKNWKNVKISQIKTDPNLVLTQYDLLDYMTTHGFQIGDN